MNTKVLSATRSMIATSLVLAMLCGIVTPAIRASALVTNPAPTAKVSFTFDDGLASTYTQAAPTLATYGQTGTVYVTTGCVGMKTVPNTCRADGSKKYMTWAQVKALQNDYKWDIGSHTVTHPYMASSDANDGQPNPLTEAQVRKELVDSKAALAAKGINATDYASPYGDYNNVALQEIAKVYATHRGFADQNNNDWSYNDYLLNNMQVQAGVTVAQVKAKIDDAIANKRWLVLTFHDIAKTISSDPGDYQYKTADLAAIASYVKTKQAAGVLNGVNVNKGAVTSDTNMLANGNFAQGLTNWTTDNTTAFKADNATNGSYPEATNAVKLTAGAATAHLYSTPVAVSSSTQYMFKNFVNLKTNSGGELAFYVDEYDATGAWVSGQYLKAERSAFVENLNFTYTPSSAAVTSAGLQVILTGNSGITGYLDNSQMFALTNPPTTTPTPTPTPTQTNLVSNGEFDAGISGGWRTDNTTAIVADTAGNGASTGAQNSIKLTASPNKQGHLFSPLTSVSNTKSYTLLNYLDVKSISSGEIGYYIDEYDAAGNWVSGQYKKAVKAVGAKDISMTYTPSSAKVATASLQVIVVAGSGTTAYIDNVRWYQN